MPTDGTQFMAHMVKWPWYPSLSLSVFFPLLLLLLLLLPLLLPFRWNLCPVEVFNERVLLSLDWWPAEWTGPLDIYLCVCASAMDFFSCVFPGSGTVSPLGDALDSLTHPRNHSWPSTPLNPGDQGWTRGGGLVVGAFPLKSLTSSPLTPPCQRWLYPSGLFFFFSFLFFLFFFFFFFLLFRWVPTNFSLLPSFSLSLPSALRPPPSAPFLHP